MLNLRYEGGRHDRREPARNRDEQESLQRAKKVLRSLNELANKVDESIRKCQKIEVLFTPTLNGLRHKIREIAGNFVKNTPYSNQHSGILDYAWRKGSYEVVQNARKIKQGQSWNEIEISYIKGHLVNSFGHYQHLVLELDAGLDFEVQTSYGIFQEEVSLDNKKRNAESPNKKIIFKCLMYMGDLSRYHLDFLEENDSIDVFRKLAKRFYHQSLALDSSYGQPFNQLAALSLGQGHGMISIYYYLRCLTSTHKFEGAEGNLKQLLEKNHTTSNNETKKLTGNLMSLMKELLYDESTKNLSNVCKTTLDHVVQCTYIKSNLNSQSSLHGILSLLLVKELLSSSASDSKKATKLSMIDAFLLAWFTHLTTKILADLQYHLFGPDAMIELFENKNEKKLENGHVENGVHKDTNEAEKQEKPKKKDLRRRRRRLFISDSEGSDLSENESDEPSDNESESEDEEDESELLTTESETDDDEDILIEDSETLISVKTMMVLIRDHPMLESFQICCHWLKSNPQIIHEAVKVGEKSSILWKRLAMLLTKTDTKNYDQDLDEVKAENDYAFPEDKIARGMKIFEERQKLLQFDSEKHLSKDEIGMSRLAELHQFKLWLCTLPQSPFALSQDNTSVLEFNGVDNIKDVTKETTGKGNENKEQENLVASKVNLMENMAQLWLQQEVKDLEGHEELYSPYLVVDHLAMMNHMFAVKDIVASKKFAVIVPNAVVQQLDGMKKELKARNAIRWLEKQFQLGNRWLRGQKSNECKDLDNVTYPSRKEREEWHFFKVLECLNYFSDQNRNKFGVTLLTSRDITVELLEKAKSVGLKVETVDEFLTKCKIPKRKRIRPKQSTKTIENG